MQRLSLALFYLLAATASEAQEVAESPTPQSAIPVVVDRQINQQLSKAAIAPALLAGDSNLLRRTMLDLVGRIPTAAEAQAYAADTSPDKRQTLVDQLMSTPEFVRHQVNEFNSLLMPDRESSLADYLRVAVEENRSWATMFRELLLPDPDRQPSSSPFLRVRLQEPDKLTNDVSVLFFGVNVSCAQCHDHPLVPAWSQEHFFGMKSFLSRTFEAGDFIGERDYGSVAYKTTSGKERTAALMFLTGAVVGEPPAPDRTDEQRKEERQLLERLKKEKKPPPPPAFSRRAQLVDVALRDPDNAYFARAFVNRLWQRLFGRGLVHPIDQMHPENPASHPELLDWLARDFIDHGYDWRRLLRGLVLSDAYARSSRWEAGGEPPAPELFAVANLRPLTPSQYATSLRLASMNPDWFAADRGSPEFQKQVDQVAESARGLARLIEQPGEDFQVSIAEALLFNNAPQIVSDFLRDGSDSLVGKLAQINDTQAAIEAATWNVLGRPPDEEESQLLASLLQQHPAQDRAAAARQVVWVLLTSSEARFNH